MAQNYERNRSRSRQGGDEEYDNENSGRRQRDRQQEYPEYQRYERQGGSGYSDFDYGNQGRSSGGRAGTDYYDVRNSGSRTRDDQKRYGDSGYEMGYSEGETPLHRGNMNDYDYPNQSQGNRSGMKNSGQGYSSYDYDNQWRGRGSSNRQNMERYSNAGQYAGMGPKGYQRADERIQEEVNETLTRHGDIDPSNVDVNVSNGEVTLSGTVNDRWTKRRIEDEIEWISGVKEVHNQIRVQREQGTSNNQTNGNSQPVTNGNTRQGKRQISEN